MPKAAPIHRFEIIGSPASYAEALRPSASERGYGGKRWQKTRRACFLRDAYVCQDCGALCIEGDEDARRWPHCDHIKPKSKGGKDELSNTETLCGSCHDRKTRREGKR